MASTNKTINIKLNQWLGTDKPKIADLNSDNSKLDSEINDLKTGKLGTTAKAADSSKLDGKSAGNASGNIPVNNGVVNTNLNAEMINGRHILSGTSAPSGGVNGDIYIQYE